MDTAKLEPVGVIDLGTQSCLLLVGRRDGDRLEVLEDRCELPALGEGLARSGRLSEVAMERALAVLGGFASRARELGCSSVRAYGTAAMRRAENAAVLVAAARERHGLELVVVAPEREAALAWSAAAGPGGDPATRVIDVGGGSTEVAQGGGLERLSAPVGAVVLSEDLGVEASWEALVGAAREALRAAGGQLGPARRAPTVALGGSASNLGSMALGLAKFDHLAVEGAVVTAEQLAHFGASLAATPVAKRCEHPIEAARAAILPAGLACLAAATELLGAAELRVSGRGLRYALMAESLGLV
ncbi:MAG: hypothetical protein P1V81_05085 [Planctomycetota bacterium]|nr:hypothetical protein [Planctomycetota bacterium]